VAKYRATGGLSHTEMAESLDEKLKELDFPTEDFSLHSLRVGGATTGANAGVPDRLIIKAWAMEIRKYINWIY